MYYTSNVYHINRFVKWGYHQMNTRRPKKEMRLAEWMDDCGIGNTEVATLLGKTDVDVYRYKTGRVLPGPHVVVKIEEISDGSVTYNSLFAAWKERHLVIRKPPKERTT